MSKGLDQIFAKIKSEPRQTLVNRYLALVAELPEQEKAERALELARHFVESNPDEALRIARMIHDEQTSEVAPFDIMIAAMEAKGRYAKAEVLKIERDKRVKKSGDGKKKSAATDGDEEEDIAQHSAMSEMSEVSLDLDAAADAGGYNDALDFLFEDSGVGHQPAAAAAGPALPAPAAAAPRVATPSQAAFLKNLEGLGGAGPLDTVMPQHHRQAVPSAGSETPTIHLGSLTDGGINPPQDAFAGMRWSEPAGAPVPYTPPPRELTFVELFDHYWRQGFFNEARDLLTQTVSRHGHEAWWQARQAQVMATLGEKKARISDADREAAAVETAGPMPKEDFWRPIYDEMARLTAGTKALLVPHAATEQLSGLLRRAPRGDGLPAGFVKALQEIDLRAAGSDVKGDGPRVMALLRDLVSGLWAGAPDRVCADVLLKLDAAHRDPGLWGFYLDGLIASGGARHALADMRSTLELKPKLEWAAAAYRRLPAVWQALGTYGFTWRDDDGVAALRERLAVRPRPKLSAIVLTRSA